jgi:hypothetical protein
MQASERDPLRRRPGSVFHRVRNVAGKLNNGLTKETRWNAPENSNDIDAAAR